MRALPKNKGHDLMTGYLFVLSGPSGVGKTSICKQLCSNIESLNWSVSTTTRPQREGEINGKDYHFVSREEFLEKLEQNYFIEHAKVHDNFYGTSKETLLNGLKEGNNYLIEIDVQGARKIKENIGKNCTFIFITPPNFETLRDRLINRKSENSQVIKKRLKNAMKELEESDFYNHIIPNVELEKTIEKIEKIIIDTINPSKMG